jgi:hypothetical protein
LWLLKNVRINGLSRYFKHWLQRTPSQVQCDDANTGFHPASLPKGSTNDALMASNAVDASLPGGVADDNAAQEQRQGEG